MGSENTPQTQTEEKKKRSVAGIIVNVIIGIILVLVFIITLNIIISSVSGKGYNSMFGTAFMAVKTESMSTKSGYTPPDGKPAGFEKGDLLFVKEKNDDMIFEEGDIITFYAERGGKGEIVTHRITTVSKDNRDKYIFYTKGDTIKVGDDYIENTAGDNVGGNFLSYDDVIGKYTGSKIGWVGNVGLFLETAVGYWLLIGVPALLILIYCIISFVLAVTKRNKVELADEKDKIRAQILAELRAEQGLPPIEAAAPAKAPEPALPEEEPFAEEAAEEEPEANEEPAEEPADDIPVVDDDDMDASIERIRNELAAEYGDVEEPAAQPEPKPAAAKKPAAKPTTSSTAKKPAAKKTTSTTAKKTTAASTTKKTTTTKKAAPAKGGLIGTGAKKPAAKKPTKTDD